VALFWNVVALVLYVYFLLLLFRIVIEFTRQFARSWRPVGGAAVGVELVYLSTDPPVKTLRRLIPPLRLGSVTLDLSVMILWIAILALQSVALNLAG
jgi:YggT family protein